LHVDHLGTLRLATDDAQTVVWRWDSDAFGATLADGDPDGDGAVVTVNLRQQWCLTYLSEWISV